MANKKTPDRLAGGFEYFKISQDKRSEDYPCHWHDFYEFEWLRRGSFIHRMNDNETLLNAGDLVLCTTTDIHSLEVDRGRIEIITMHFDDSYLTATSKKAINSLKNREFSFDEKTVKIIDDIFSVLFDLQENKFINKKENIKNRIETILLYCIEADSDKKQKLSGLMEAIGYIDNNFRESISLEAAAKIAGLSRGAFSATFHKEMGVTFQEYLINKRIKWASTLLINTDLNITQIAFDSGFRSHSHFNHSFKTNKGVSPAVYREKHLKNSENGQIH